MILRAIIVCLIAILIFFALGYNKVEEAHAETYPVATSTPVVEKHTDPLFEMIGWCESHGDIHSKNTGSSASGEFQFLWGSWNYYGKMFWGKDFYSKNIWSNDNRELAWFVYKKYGTRDWESSKSCWGKVAMVTL